VNPSGVATVSDKEHARDMLSVADSPDQVKAIIAVLDREMTAAQKSPKHVREDQRKEITGKKATGPSGAKGDYIELRTTKDGRTLGKKADGTIEEVK
jgi:hypothetical protein